MESTGGQSTGVYFDLECSEDEDIEEGVFEEDWASTLKRQFELRKRAASQSDRLARFRCKPGEKEEGCHYTLCKSCIERLCTPIAERQRNGQSDWSKTATAEMVLLLSKGMI